jgi:hypothetical protein
MMLWTMRLQHNEKRGEKQKGRATAPGLRSIDTRTAHRIRGRARDDFMKNHDKYKDSNNGRPVVVVLV